MASYVLAGAKKGRAVSTFDVESAPVDSRRGPIPLSDIDMVLTSQLVVAWAGETGEGRGLGWWESDLVSEYGGEDLFGELLPSTSGDSLPGGAATPR